MTVITLWCHNLFMTCQLLLTRHVSACRSGSRTGAPSGRSARRPPTCSGLRGLCCRRTTAFLSSRRPRRQRPRWTTASAPSTPTTPAGPRQGCPACLSCSSRRPWAASRPWRSPCLSAASAPGSHTTPWVYPTCRPTAPGCSLTSTSPRSPGWYPRPCPARPTWPARLSCVAPRTVTSGEGQASRRCAAKRWSTQYPWVSPRELLFPSHWILLRSVLTHPTSRQPGKYNQDTVQLQRARFPLKSRPGGELKRLIRPLTNTRLLLFEAITYDFACSLWRLFICLFKFNLSVGSVFISLAHAASLSADCCWWLKTNSVDSWTQIHFLPAGTHRNKKQKTHTQKRKKEKKTPGGLTGQRRKQEDTEEDVTACAVWGKKKKKKRRKIREIL